MVSQDDSPFYPGYNLMSFLGDVCPCSRTPRGIYRGGQASQELSDDALAPAAGCSFSTWLEWVSPVRPALRGDAACSLPPLQPHVV